jgi:hypothetical protein
VIGAMNGLAVGMMTLLGTLAVVGSIARGLVAFIGWRTAWRHRITGSPERFERTR